MPKIQYQIKNHRGYVPATEKVSGETFSGAPGLAVRNSGEYGWKVDHLASGFYVQTFDLKRQARAFALYLCSKIDCTQKMRRLQKEVQEKKLAITLKRFAESIRVGNPEK